MKQNKKTQNKIKKEIQNVEKYGRHARGRSEYLRSLNGEYLNRNEITLAACYSCCGYYTDGTFDCGNIICPHYGRMPYKNITQKEGEILD